MVDFLIIAYVWWRLQKAERIIRENDPDLYGEWGDY